MSEQNESEILKPGMIVDGYRIERELGRGAMAVVYLTQQLNLQRPVALKIMSMEFAANKDYVRRFFNEVRTAAALSHPNIVQAYDAGVAFENTYYFAMEYVDGVSMLKKIESEGRIPALEALAYARAIASALDYGWQKMRFRHGDIKPENFMVQKDGQIKLTDFGLAMVKGHEYHGNELMLTPHYASPELIQGIRSKNNCLADIYAFGASLYHMLSGTTPYVGDDAREVMRRHLNEKLEPLRHRCPDIPKCLSEFVGDIMEKDPSRRLQDWTMVLSGIDAVTDELLAKRAVVGTEKEQFSESPETITLKTLEGKKARPLTAQKRRLTARAYRDYRKKKSFSGWVIADVLIVLLVLGLVGFYFYRQNKGEKIRREFGKTAQIIQQVNPNLNVEESMVPELKQEPRQSDDIKNGKKDAPLAHESVVEKQAVPAFPASGEKPQEQKDENDLSAVRALIESPAAVLQNGKSAPQKSAIVVKKLRLPDY
ncbi:MAG: serine/threonine-protein kinase, partial [Lentisphaeria bacterium]